MTEKTRFDRAFDDHLLARDLALVAFLVVGYGVPMKFALGMPWRFALASGVGFAVLWLALMEVVARRKGSSMFRYFGGDPLA